MRAIFNSLGSNYSFEFVFLALKQIFVSKNYATDQSIDKLHRYLDKTYQGKSFLFYKGRDAIEFSLRVLFADASDGGSARSRVGSGKVLTQAFSCFAVEEGIKRAGMTPVYVDIDENSTNMSVKTLNNAFAENKDSKAVLVQHSLGIPADIIAIKEWCKKNDLILIEDLAQAVGGVDLEKQPLGKNADAIIFSFGRDKIIDAVSGGAVVFKNLNERQLKKIEAINTAEITNIPRTILIKDMIYPLVTFLGRKTHDIYIGKIILKLSRIFGLIISPTISKTHSLTRMNSAYAKLVLYSLEKLDEQIIKRRVFAKFYLDQIKNENIKILNSNDDIEYGSNLRFSIVTNRVAELIKTMKNNSIYLSDRWYRTPVDCGKQSCSSSYVSASAKNAEELSSQIFNLPTHQNISMEKATRIVGVLNKF